MSEVCHIISLVCQIISNEHKWFSHDTVLDNLTQHIGTVTVQLPPGCKREKEATLSPDSMDTEDAAIANNLQDMFSIGHNYQEDSVQSGNIHVTRIYMYLSIHQRCFYSL